LLFKTDEKEKHSTTNARNDHNAHLESHWCVRIIKRKLIKKPFIFTPQKSNIRYHVLRHHKSVETETECPTNLVAHSRCEQQKLSSVNVISLR